MDSIIRLGIVGAKPRADDRARSTRRVGIRVEMAAGDVPDMVNISVPTLGAPNPAVFLENRRERAPDPATGRPDAGRIAAFAAAAASVTTGPGGPCDPISLMTTGQEPGISCGDAPTRHARAAPCAVSLSRRTG